VELDVQQALAEAKELAADGDAWRVVARLQDVEIEEVLLNLVRADIGDLPRSHQEQAVAHAVTGLYEEWRGGAAIRSPIAWLKTAARRKASDFRRYQPAEGKFDLAVHDSPAEEDEGWDEDYMTRRVIAVEVGRQLLQDLGLPSVIDVMTVMFDLVAAGEQVGPSQIASMLNMPVGTVGVHLHRGFKRVRAQPLKADRCLPPSLRVIRPVPDGEPTLSGLARHEGGRALACPPSDWFLLFVGEHDFGQFVRDSVCSHPGIGGRLGVDDCRLARGWVFRDFKQV
jgi:DNA-directed RNA polymerase specialized sigma24 family protein